jgi:hypothetical protein
LQQVLRFSGCFFSVRIKRVKKMRKKKQPVPRSAEEDLKLEELDMAYTASLRYITLRIDTLVKNEENALTDFCSEFVSISRWVMEQTGFLAPDIKSKILAECSRLKENADNNLRLLNNIRHLTKDEEKADSKKLMIKVDIVQDFSEQKRLIKILNFPRDILELTGEIIHLVESGKKTVLEDMEIERKTMEIISEFKDNTLLISQNLGLIVSAIEEKKDLQLIKDGLSSLIRKIDEEVYRFRQLDCIERVHLQLLLSLFSGESKSIQKERLFSQREEAHVRQEKYIEEDFV